MSEHVKVRFSYETGEGTEVETMWALPCADGYEIDNVPFYVKEIGVGDVVDVVADAEGALWFGRLVWASGHSTVRLWFEDERDVAGVRLELEGLGCSSELSDLPRLVAVDVPPSVPWERAKEYFERGAQSGRFDYEEACLAAP